MNDRQRRNTALQEAKRNGGGLRSAAPATELYLLEDSLSKNLIPAVDQDRAWQRIQELRVQVESQEAEAAAKAPTTRTELSTAEQFGIFMNATSSAVDPFTVAIATGGSNEVPRDALSDVEDEFAKYWGDLSRQGWTGDMREIEAESTRQRAAEEARTQRLTEDFVSTMYPDTSAGRSAAAKKGHETRRAREAARAERDARQTKAWVDERMAKWDAEHPAP